MNMWGKGNHLNGAGRGTSGSFSFNLFQYHETVPRESHKDAGKVEFGTIEITVQVKTWEKVSLPKS